MIKFVRGFIYDVCDDAASVLEVVLELSQWRELDKYVVTGIEWALNVRDWVDY